MDPYRRAFLLIAFTLIFSGTLRAIEDQNWPSFRGPGGRGVADGFPVPSSWNADPTAGKVEGVSWRAHVPGLGHSSPIVFGDRIFLATAIAEEGEAPLKLGPGGQPTAADDNGVQSWVVLCYDKLTGAELWRRTAYRGRPRASRHAKASHANTSLTTDGRHLVAFFGSEGLYCYDLAGELRWSRDLGVINISKYGIGWGYASSPAVYQDRIALVCDDPDDPFVAVLRLSDGKEIWHVSRKGISERSWGTPMIHAGPERTQVVVNGWPWIVAYDLDAGEELWRLRGGGDNPVPTPFEADGRIYITSAHGGQSPIYVVRPEARGDITASKEESAMAIVWSTLRDGSYMSTPVVYRGYLYLGNSNGVVRCFDAKTGDKIYEKRLTNGDAIISSLVAAEGKIYCAAESGTVYVLAAGPDFKVLARNEMGESCFATPAISQGVLYFRTTKSLMAIK
jgi:outer membrane protein assembly factor BamB